MSRTMTHLHSAFISSQLTSLKVYHMPKIGVMIELQLHFAVISSYYCNSLIRNFSHYIIVDTPHKNSKPVWQVIVMVAFFHLQKTSIVNRLLTIIWSGNYDVDPKTACTDDVNREQAPVQHYSEHLPLTILLVRCLLKGTHDRRLDGVRTFLKT